MKMHDLGPAYGATKVGLRVGRGTGKVFAGGSTGKVWRKRIMFC